MGCRLHAKWLKEGEIKVEMVGDRMVSGRVSALAPFLRYLVLGSFPNDSVARISGDRTPRGAVRSRGRCAEPMWQIGFS
jgi:hypothetical protein